MIFNHNSLDFVLDWEVFLMERLFTVISWCSELTVNVRSILWGLLLNFVRCQRWSLTPVWLDVWLSTCVVLLLRVRKGSGNSMCARPYLTSQMPPPEQQLVDYKMELQFWLTWSGSSHGFHHPPTQYGCLPSIGSFAVKPWQLSLRPSS